MEPGSVRGRSDGPTGFTAVLDGVADRARQVASDGAETYRRSSRHQRMRAAVIGAWAAVAVAAVWIAWPRSGPGNALGADVQVLKESLLGGQQIQVRNESSSIWTDVRITLDGSWRYEQRTLRPGDRVVLSPSQFRRDEEPAPRNLKPRALTVECDQGRARFELH